MLFWRKLVNCIYRYAQKCFGQVFISYFTLLLFFVLSGCKPLELSFPDELVVQQFQDNKSESVPLNQHNINDEKPALAYAPANIKVVTKQQPNTLFLSPIKPCKSTVKVNENKRPNKPIAAKQHEKEPVFPGPHWFKIGFILIVISLLFLFLLLLIPTVYFVSIAIFLAGYLLFNIKYTGKLRKLATVLSVFIIQLEGLLYICGYFSLLAYTNAPFLIMLLAAAITVFLLLYLLLKVLFEMEKYPVAQDKENIRQNAERSIKIMGYAFLGFAAFFAIVLLTLMNPLVIGFVPAAIGNAILWNGFNWRNFPLVR